MSTTQLFVDIPTNSPDFLDSLSFDIPDHLSFDIPNKDFPISFTIPPQTSFTKLPISPTNTSPVSSMRCQMTRQTPLGAIPADDP